MSTPATVPQATLIELHRYHRQLSDLRERLERGPKQIKIRQANVAQNEEKLAAIQVEFKAARVAIDQKNLQLKSNEAKIAELQTKLNQANTNREYQAFKDQIAADKMAGSVLTDEILEAMEKLEEYKKTIAQAEDAVKKSKEELAKAQQALKDQEQLLLADVRRLEGELKPIEDTLPADFRPVYQRMVAGRGEDALAVLEGDCCGGCHHHITANMIAEVKLSRIVFCKSCGRILYQGE